MSGTMGTGSWANSPLDGKSETPGTRLLQKLESGGPGTPTSLLEIGAEEYLQSPATLRLKHRFDSVSPAHSHDTFQELN
jgi:hypothetical protein